jgi:hypothetical protein
MGKVRTQVVTVKLPGLERGPRSKRQAVGRALHLVGREFNLLTLL